MEFICLNIENYTCLFKMAAVKKVCLTGTTRPLWKQRDCSITIAQFAVLQFRQITCGDRNNNIYNSSNVIHVYSENKNEDTCS